MNVRNRSALLAACTILIIAAPACSKRSDEPPKAAAPTAPPVAAPAAAEPPPGPPAVPPQPTVVDRRAVTPLGMLGLRVDQPVPLAEVERMLEGDPEVHQSERGAARRQVIAYPPIFSVSFPADKQAPFLWFETPDSDICLDGVCIDTPIAEIADRLDPTCTAHDAVEVMAVACRLTGTPVLVVTWHWLDLAGSKRPASVPLADVLEPSESGRATVQALVWVTPGASWVPEPLIEEGDAG